MSLNDRFKEFTSKTYAKQGVAFLNAYWGEVEGDATLLWDFTNQFIALDHENGKEGSDLDEFNAHRFLERLGETRTVKEMRDELREIDMDFNKRMALIEYFLWRYGKTVSDFVERPQGSGDPRELEEAQRLVDLAKAGAEEAIALERPFKEAQEELNQALAELHKQEEEYHRRCEELESRSQDQNLGVVQRNKAANELAQLKAQDPLPLRQAKISTEAAERKSDRARAPFKEARERAEREFDEAERFMQEVMARGTIAHGQIWWLNKELQEAKKYLPKSKQ